MTYALRVRPMTPSRRGEVKSSDASRATKQKGDKTDLMLSPSLLPTVKVKKGKRKKRVKKQ